MGGVFDNIGSSAKGMFTDGAGEKAVLYVYFTDLSKKESEDDDFNTEVTALKELQTTLLSNTKSRITPSNMWSDFKNAVKPGSKSSQKVGEIASENKKFMKFTVQYNPATIRLYSVNGKVQSRRAEESIDRLSVYRFSGKSKLSFDLIFDDVDNVNAFGLNEMTTMNATNALNKGLSAYSHGGLTYSVRKKMDAIMSLLASSATQQVIFFWGNMCFRGTITDVGNKFTMFNPSGNPIRGEMHLEITQDKKTKVLEYDESYWQKSFEKCFSNKNTKGADMAAGGQSGWSKLVNNNFINVGL